jgi:hypothetical protein
MNRSSVVIHPEIAAKALKIREADLYLLWLVLRAMDAEKGGRGIVHVDDIRHTCAKILGVTLKWAYEKINEGVGKYWREPTGKKGDRTVGLIGQSRVYERLKPEMTRSEPFVISAAMLCADDGLNLKRLKQLLISLVAARFVDNRPVTVSQIMEHTGLSEATIRAALRDCSLIVKVPNYEVVHRASTREEALLVKRKLSIGKRMFRVTIQGGTWVVAQQMGNTYRVPQPDRMPLRARPRKLKDFDRENARLYGNRRYYQKLSQAGKEGVCYLNQASIGCTRAALWATRQNDEMVMPKTRGGKWNRLVQAHQSFESVCAKAVSQILETERKQ